MRLRRETGDFQIKMYYDSTKTGVQAYSFNTIRKGLAPDDLIGEVIVQSLNTGDTCFAILSASDYGVGSANYVMLCAIGPNAMPLTAYYNPADGSITTTQPIG